MGYVGWYPRRRGILEHLDRGTISLLDLAIHDFLCLICDHKTGVAFASAEKIKALCPSDISYKSIQRSLAKMSRLGWIKRWMVRGRRGNYPILVCRFFVRDVSMVWWSTSGVKTTDWRDVQFDPVHDVSFNCPGGVRETDRETDREVSGIQEKRGKDERTKSIADKPLTKNHSCAFKTKGVWEFTGIFYDKLPKWFRNHEVDEYMRSLFEMYVKTSHSSGECHCEPIEFLSLARGAFSNTNFRYPAAFLKRQAQLEKASRRAVVLGEGG